MKRDWELMGEIFNAIEEERLRDYVSDKIKLDSDEYEYPEARIFRHIELLCDAGFVEGVRFVRSNKGIARVIYEDPRITLPGYDFADTVQDKKLLNKTISLIEKAGLMVTFETLKQFAPIAVKAIADLLK